MAVLWLLLLGGLLTFFLGHFVWAVVKHFLTTEVPSSLKHPVKLRVMHCFVLFLLTLGNTLEKLRICTMSKFVQFFGDIGAIKKDPTVVVTSMCFGSIPVRLFQPKGMSSKLRRGIIFYHGGGAIFGSMAREFSELQRGDVSHVHYGSCYSWGCSDAKCCVFSSHLVHAGPSIADTYHSLCSFLVRETDSVLLSVGYRKLPYYHHPVLFNDCLSATIQFLKGLETYGVDPSRVVLCGESVGAWVVATIVQVLLSSPSLPKIRAQILITPITQAINFCLPSHQKSKNVPFLTREIMIFCLCKYLAIDVSWKDAMLTGAVIPPDKWKKYKKWISSDNIPRRFWSQDLQPEFLGCFNEAAYLETKHIFDVQISPVLADDKIIAQLPEVFLVTCENDILRDDGLLYKKRFEDQGVAVTWNHVEDGFHGCLLLFDWKFLSFPCSVKIVNTVVGYIKNI